MDNHLQDEVARAIAAANGDDYDRLPVDDDGYVWTDRLDGVKLPTQERYDGMAAAALAVIQASKTADA